MTAQMTLKVAEQAFEQLVDVCNDDLVDMMAVVALVNTLVNQKAAQQGATHE